MCEGGSAPPSAETLASAREGRERSPGVRVRRSYGRRSRALARLARAQHESARVQQLRAAPRPGHIADADAILRQATRASGCDDRRGNRLEPGGSPTKCSTLRRVRAHDDTRRGNETGIGRRHLAHQVSGPKCLFAARPSATPLKQVAGTTHAPCGSPRADEETERHLFTDE